MLMRTTHNLAEGAGAAGLAGLLALREELAGKTVAVILSGSNIDAATLRRVVTGELEPASQECAHAHSEVGARVEARALRLLESTQGGNNHDVPQTRWSRCDRWTHLRAPQARRPDEHRELQAERPRPDGKPQGQGTRHPLAGRVAPARRRRPGGVENGQGVRRRSSARMSPATAAVATATAAAAAVRRDAASSAPSA